MYQHFKTLELQEDASFDEVKRAYRELVKVWHPDRFINDPKLRQRAEEKTKELNDAFTELSKFYETRGKEAPREERRTATRSAAAVGEDGEFVFDHNAVLEEWERRGPSRSQRARGCLFRGIAAIAVPLFVATGIFVCVVTGRPAPAALVTVVRKVLRFFMN